MTASIAAEAQDIVRHAAEPVSAGESIKAQINRAWDVLGRPAFWRVRAAWYGEAGSWSAAALDDLRARSAKARAKEEARNREAVRTSLARFVAMRDGLAALDEDFHRAEIDRLGHVIDGLRRELAGEG